MHRGYLIFIKQNPCSLSQILDGYSYKNIVTTLLPKGSELLF